MLEGLLKRTKRFGTNPARIAELEEELRVPPLPPCLTYLWNIFCRLSSRRTSNGFGPNLITYLDIDAFQRVTRFNLTAWEVEMIETVDRLYLAEYARSRKADE